MESQYTELLSQSQADMSVGSNDEDELERDLREVNQNLLQMQQELMSADAECGRARASEEEALNTWQSKRSTCALVNSLRTLDIPRHLSIQACMNICGVTLCTTCLPSSLTSCLTCSY